QRVTPPTNRRTRGAHLASVLACAKIRAELPENLCGGYAHGTQAIEPGDATVHGRAGGAPADSHRPRPGGRGHSFPERRVEKAGGGRPPHVASTRDVALGAASARAGCRRDGAQRRAGRRRGFLVRLSVARRVAPARGSTWLR